MYSTQAIIHCAEMAVSEKKKTIEGFIDENKMLANVDVSRHQTGHYNTH